MASDHFHLVTLCCKTCSQTHPLNQINQARWFSTKVGENLYRLESTGKYYGLLKRGGKQFRRSLKTRDRKLAERRLTELRQQIGNLSLTEDGDASFEEVARHWVETTRHSIKREQR
jgi:hypothetical protein